MTHTRTRSFHQSSSVTRADVPAGGCTFGAPLVASVLQRLGALSSEYDPTLATPATLEDLDLRGKAYFKRPVPIRTMEDCK